MAVSVVAGAAGVISSAYSELICLLAQKFGGNWLERLKMLKQIHQKFAPTGTSSSATSKDENAPSAENVPKGDKGVLTSGASPNTDAASTDFTAFM